MSLDLTTVGLYNSLHDGEAEAAARLGLYGRHVRAVEPIEQPARLGSIEADPGVRHAEDGRAAAVGEADGYAPTDGRILHGVREQVVHHLRKRRGLSGDGDARRYVHVEAHPLRLGLGAKAGRALS